MVVSDVRFVSVVPCCRQAITGNSGDSCIVQFPYGHFSYNSARRDWVLQQVGVGMAFVPEPNWTVFNFFRSVTHIPCEDPYIFSPLPLLCSQIFSQFYPAVSLTCLFYSRRFIVNTVVALNVFHKSTSGESARDAKL